MADEENTQPADTPAEQTQPSTGSATPTRASDRPPERLVRHVFWKYPILAGVLFVVVAVLAAALGSPNWPRDTIAAVTKDNPGGAILAFTQELDGTATSTSNAAEFGVGDPAQVFVLGPLKQVARFGGLMSEMHSQPMTMRWERLCRAVEVQWKRELQAPITPKSTH